MWNYTVKYFINGNKFFWEMTLINEKVKLVNPLLERTLS